MVNYMWRRPSEAPRSKGISRGRVDIGESLLSGAGNALSEVLYGTGPIRGVKDAFIRGAKTGAVMSGLDNLARAAGLRGAEPGSNPGGAVAAEEQPEREYPDMWGVIPEVSAAHRIHSILQKRLETEGGVKAA